MVQQDETLSQRSRKNLFTYASGKSAQAHDKELPFRIYLSDPPYWFTNGRFVLPALQIPAVKILTACRKGVFHLISCDRAASMSAVAMHAY